MNENPESPKEIDPEDSATDPGGCPRAEPGPGSATSHPEPPSAAISDRAISVWAASYIWC